MESSRLHGVYAITDQKLIPDDRFGQHVEAVLRGGARILQYRDKSDDAEKRRQQAGICRELCNSYQALFIINDDIELCRQAGADGVHLGKQDGTLAHARERLGEDAVIGISCYNDIERAVSAQQNGADYAAFGTMFASATKPKAVLAGPEIFTRAKQQVSLPLCGIGGITMDNAGDVVAAGANMLALISTLFAASDIEETTRRLSSCFH